MARASITELDALLAAVQERGDAKAIREIQMRRAISGVPRVTARLRVSPRGRECETNERPAWLAIVCNDQAFPLPGLGGGLGSYIAWSWRNQKGAVVGAGHQQIPYEVIEARRARRIPLYAGIPEDKGTYALEWRLIVCGKEASRATSIVRIR